MANQGDLSAEDFVFERGDVNITVKLKDGIMITGKVSAEAMALASRVWKKFMYPPWKIHQIEAHNPDSAQSERTLELAAKRAKTGHQPTRNMAQGRAEIVDFSDDDCEALLILLRIAHLYFGKVPTTISSKALLTVAVLCDLYQCVGLIKPWLKEWILSFTKPLTSISFDCIGENEVGNEAALFIFWSLGMESHFTRLADDMVMDLRIDGEGNYFKFGGAPPSSHIPSGLTESITARREQAIEALIQLPYNLIDQFTVSAGPRLCRKENSQAKACDSLVCGSLLLCLQEKKMWPRERSKQIRDSVSNLICEIDNIH